MSRSGIATALSLLLGVTLGLGQVPTPATAKATAKPVVTKVVQGSGPAAGGYDVTIKGSGFTNVKKVLFDRAKARDVRVRNGSKLVVEVPPHAAGTVPVTVVTKAGTSARSTKARFTYVAAPPPPPPPAALPSLAAVSPAAGPTGGGTQVTISGVNLTGASDVRFSGTSATVLNVSPTAVTVRTPARAAGPAYLTVTTPTGTAALVDGFTYVARPTLTDVTPATGPVAGSTVTLTGTGFTPATAVDFGGSSGSDVQVAAGGQELTVRTPARSAGFVDVRVTTVGGSATLSRGFQYVAGVGITGISPAAGPTAGGTEVTITGAGFTGNSLVTFDNKPSLEVSVNLSGTALTAEVPPHAAGTVDVLVATVGGAAFLPSGFTYVAAPTLTSITPDAGPTAGGQRVTLTGTGLRAGTEVRFGGTLATLRSVSPDGTSATADTPAHAPGTVDVSVTSAGGTASRAAAFTYAADPDLTGVAPDTGPSAGGQRVTLTGSGFVAGMSVRFGTVPATGVTVVSPTHATVTTPARAVGTAAVAVTTPGGSDSLDDAYTFVSAPTLAAVSPAAGPTGGGTTLVLTGTGLRPGVQVEVGGRTADLVSVGPAGTTATVLTPAHAPGLVAVSATTAGGTATLPAAYSYTDAPTLTAVAPGSGPTAGGQVVTLTGAGLRAGMQVRFGGVLATVGSVGRAGTTASVTTPAHAPGVVDVSVLTAGGSGSLPGGFEYVVAPSLDALTPAAGPTTGGQSVTLTGAGFRGDMQVRFGSTPATFVSVNAAGTTATVTTPARAASLVDVSLSTAGGTATLADGYTFVLAPTLISVTPATGPTAGGRVVTLRGTAFRDGMQVAFGGAPATGLVVESSTRASVVTPVHAPGPVAVTLSTPGGSDALPAGYEYVAAPSLASVTPAAGPAAGGQAVTLSGTGLRADMQVRFGTAPATVVSVDPDGTSATVTTPARPAGAVDVAVTTAGGVAVLAGGFEYVAPPSLTSLTPTEGPTTGGQVVTLTGTRLRPGMEVRFGTAAATVLAVAPDGRSASVATPARAAGAVTVSVTTPGGTAVLADGYTFVVAPALSSVSPGTGRTSGGETVTLRGAGFRAGMLVSFGGTPAGGLVVESPTRATVVAPARAAGVVDVSVTTPGGSATLAAAYEFVAAPTVTGVSPAEGPTTGGQSVTVTGTGLRAGMQVRFGTTVGTVTSVDPAGTSATVTTPARGAGLVDVSVTTPGGTGTLAAAYTFVAAPTLTSVEPAAGPAAGGQTVTLRGTGFRDGMVVRLDGVPAGGLVVASGSRATVVTPPHPAGSVDVTVSSPGGADTLPGSYEYLS